MVKLKRDALRLTAMSLGVLVGGTLSVVGVMNVIVRLRAEPAPSWPLVALVTVLGAVLVAWPTWVALRDALAARRG